MDVSDDLPTENTTNKQVEDAAIAFVLRHEDLRRAPARDTRGRGVAADIVSRGRVIEVKACGGSARGQDLWLEVRQVEEARANPDFWLYVVDNVGQGDPTKFQLLQIGGQELVTLLARAKERGHYEVPFPVASYKRFLDQSPS